MPPTSKLVMQDVVSLSHNINTTEGKAIFLDQERSALSLRVLTVILSKTSTLICLISHISQKVSLVKYYIGLATHSNKRVSMKCTFYALISISELQNCQSNFTKNVRRIKCLKRQCKDRSEECYNFKTNWLSITRGG